VTWLDEEEESFYSWPSQSVNLSWFRVPSGTHDQVFTPLTFGYFRVFGRHLWQDDRFILLLFTVFICILYTFFIFILFYTYLCVLIWYVYVHVYSQASQSGYCAEDYSYILMFLRHLRHLNDRTLDRHQIWMWLGIQSAVYIPVRAPCSLLPASQWKLLGGTECPLWLSSVDVFWSFCDCQISRFFSSRSHVKTLRMGTEMVLETLFFFRRLTTRHGW
jgi:hypothetical protein